MTSKLKDYPQFQAIAVAVRKSGFKVRGHCGYLNSTCRFLYGAACARARQVVVGPDREGSGIGK